VDDWHNSYTMTIAPKYINGMVIVGTSGGEYLTRGHVDAYDAKTGNHIWRFYTTEPTTWAGNSYLQGGAPVWHNPTFDPKLDLLYVATGNAGPDINGVPRAGVNLYTVAVVALNAKTGALAWYYQESHHDLWDYDATSPIVLFSLNGTPALAHQGKTGFTFILDRRTGTPLYPVNEVAVPTVPEWQNPWPTQPESTVESLTPHSVEPVPAGYTAAPMWAPPQEQPLVMQPADEGGQEWPPSAYSPRTKFLYQHARYIPRVFQTSPTNISGGNFPGWGSTTDDVTGITEYGLVGAVDTTTGKIAWQIKLTDPPDCGWVVAGDVGFFGEVNGMFHGVDAATGQILWTFNALTIPGAGGATAGPIAYMVDNREYIAMPFGGKPPDAPVGDAVIAFTLPH
jgi:quinohemoprotein ethanol dehydrogenase